MTQLLELYVYLLQHRKVADWLACRDAIGKELMGMVR